tara:strand:- start:307 stop:765 length:459 start_codon:yes stop_codon:yes gene_type:complete
MTLTTKHLPISRDEFLTPFDSLFDNVIEKAFPGFGEEFGVTFFGNHSYPKVNVIDRDERLEIEASIPGLSKDDVSVELEKEVLSISGGRQDQPEDKGARYIRKELKRSSFRRSFRLTGSFDTEGITADFKDGILLVSIPKSKPDKPEKIKIL